MARPVVLVISKERTATQAVYHSLQAGIGGRVMHAHYLDSSHRPPAALTDPAYAKKIARERHVAEALALAERRAYVTILRPLPDRMLSALWYQLHGVAAGDFDGARPLLEGRLRGLLAKDAAYDALVYDRIGAPRGFGPGRHRLAGRDVLYALDFKSLAAGFADLATELTGVALPLLRTNSGEDRGGPLYGQFRAWAAPIIEQTLAERAAA